MVAETFIKESRVLPSQNLQLPVTAAGQAQRALNTWLEHRASSSQSLQGPVLQGAEQGDTQMVFQQVCQLSVEVRCQEAPAGTILIPPASLPRAAGGWGRCCLQNRACHSILQRKCALQGRKNMLQLPKGIWCPLCFCCCSAVPLACTSAGVP